MNDVHRPLRPQWTCAVDGDAWPCVRVRARLTEAYRADRGGLTTHLATLMVLAAADLGSADAVALNRRFLAWTLAPERGCRVCGRGGHDAVPVLPPRLVPCEVAGRIKYG